MLSINKLALFCLMVIMPLVVFSQSKEELKKQKIAIEKEIDYTTGLLNKTKQNKNKSLNYLSVLEKQIQNKEQLLKTLNFEIKLINRQINKTENNILEIEESILTENKSLEALKAEYSKMIYAAFIKKGKRNDLMFVISSKDFNQTYKRIRYLKQYTEFRKTQAKKIKESQLLLELKKAKIVSQKEQLLKESKFKARLISSKKDEILFINNSKSEKNQLIRKLSKSEELIKRQLKAQKQTAKELETQIRKIIDEEIKKAREKMNSKKGHSLTSSTISLSKEFATNKGNLPWPIEEGVVVQFYGKQKHPIFSGVETINNGIDISTEKNAIVRTVFDGDVSRIFFIKGTGKAILINHGEYFSVYSGLKDVYVKAGEKVLSKEKIGVVQTHESEQKTELHFEIWKGYKKEDPSEWLFRAY